MHRRATIQRFTRVCSDVLGQARLAVHWGHHARTDEVATLDMVQEFLSRK